MCKVRAFRKGDIVTVVAINAASDAHTSLGMESLHLRVGAVDAGPSEMFPQHTQFKGYYASIDDEPISSHEIMGTIDPTKSWIDHFMDDNYIKKFGGGPPM